MPPSDRGFSYQILLDDVNIAISKTGLVISALLPLGIKWVFVIGWPVHCRMVSSSPPPPPPATLDVSNTSHRCVKMFLDITSCPRRLKKNALALEAPLCFPATRLSDVKSKAEQKQHKKKPTTQGHHKHPEEVQQEVACNNLCTSTKA